MSQSTDINNLVINKLTKVQYESITPSDTEIYLITDDIGITASDLMRLLEEGAGIRITMNNNKVVITSTASPSYTAGNGITISNNVISIADAVVFDCGTSVTVT